MNNKNDFIEYTVKFMIILVVKMIFLLMRL